MDMEMKAGPSPPIVMGRKVRFKFVIRGGAAVGHRECMLLRTAAPCAALLPCFLASAWLLSPLLNHTAFTQHKPADDHHEQCTPWICNVQAHLHQTQTLLTSCTTLVSMCRALVCAWICPKY